MSEEKKFDAPPMPEPVFMDILTLRLIELLPQPFASQRNAARELLEQYSYELGPSMQRLIEAGKVDRRARQIIERILKARRPG